MRCTWSPRLLRGAERLHAGVDPDVRHDGRGDRLVACGQGPLRSARPVALSRAGRARHFESRRVCIVRSAHRVVAGQLRGDRQDGHSRDAAARLSRRRRNRLDLRRRHARHPDPAVDHVHPLRHRHRNVDRAAVPRRRVSGPDAHRRSSCCGRSSSSGSAAFAPMRQIFVTPGAKNSARFRRSRRSSRSSSA